MILRSAKTRTKVESDRLGRRKYLGAVLGAALTVTVLYSLYGFLRRRLCVHCKLTVAPFHELEFLVGGGGGCVHLF